LEFSRGTFSTFESASVASQIGVVSPPRYRFHTMNARRIGTNASRRPSGEYAPSHPHGSGSFSGNLPSTSIVYN
jgi:hypothetical protein